MTSKKENDYKFDVGLLIFIGFIWVTVIIFVEPKYLIESIGIIIGIAVPVRFEILRRRKNEQNSREAFVRWCEVTTNSNLTHIDQKIGQLKELENHIAESGSQFLFLAEAVHSDVQKVLDVEAYTGLLNSGLFTEMEPEFQNTLFFLRESITKFSAIISDQKLKLRTQEEEFNSGRDTYEITKKRAFLHKDIADELLVKFNSIKEHLEKLKKLIQKYKKEFGF